MSSPRFAFLSCASLLLAVGCGGDGGGGGDAGAGDGAAACPAPQIGWALDDVGATPGVSRTVALRMLGDHPCDGATIAVVSTNPSVATVPEEVVFAVGQTEVPVDVTGVGVGTTTITATWTVADGTRTADMVVHITEPVPPACSGTAEGNLAPGGKLASSEDVEIALPEGAARDDRYHVDPFTATIGCAADQLPEGYRALGPAVTFGPVHLRFMREIPMTVPLRLALLPAGARPGHVEMSYTGPGVSEPRIVPVAVHALAGDWGSGTLTFEAPRLGTYQAVVRVGAGATRMREFTFDGITGVSMGGFGSGLIGFRNMERFDFVAPLGAAWDWAYLLDYIRTYHMGGFCTDEERTADPEGCAAGASVERVPSARHVHEHIQDFEHWWYEDDHGGQGGTFDRREYIRLFRDLSFMFGNPNTDRAEDAAEPNITPPGVPDSERMRDPGTRCNNPVVIPPHDGSPGTGYFDDEYNPSGAYPVITFCDGSEVVVGGERDVGIWDAAGSNTTPLEVALAVDVNGNGRRDAGEPVVRSGREPFRDCGLDVTCNPDEAGYDPVTNPDPAGDDYDYQYNPAGTEGSFLREGEPCGAGEDYDDFGLDGVEGTAQLADGGFDRGEGNGCFDMARGSQRMLDRGPKQLVLSADAAALRDTDVFADGGIRDLFNFAVAANHSIGAFAARDLSVRYYNQHSALHLDGRGADEFVFTDIDWTDVGDRVMVRYGDIDASEGRIESGDGAHVGTNEQAVNRLLSALAWMSARWPEGDRRRVSDRICAADVPSCENPNEILVDFESPSSGRVGPTSIILPPGYFQEEYADYEYPVVYFLHGYGMSPEDLIDIGIIIWNYMISPAIPQSQRLQKMIFVFPDGRCRGDECVKGTFYTDAPEGSPGAAQMETYMLDLMDYIDANYRTRAPQTFEVAQ